MLYSIKKEWNSDPFELQGQPKSTVSHKGTMFLYIKY